MREHGRTMLVLEDPGGEPLGRLLGAPMELERFLRLALGIATALGKAHQRGLVHKDIKPANIFVNTASGNVRLTGFGIASRLPRERQALEPPETIAGTLAYMAPEPTGRMNRSINSRSDLYSLGVTFYQMLTGALPFTASDPIEWVHCHTARQPLPPSKRLATVPVAVSQIVMKLLAKTAEERYQTAGGVERDLRRCLTDWEAHGRIDDFPLGRHDTPDRLVIHEMLYGRAREVETLLVSFDHIVRSGAPDCGNELNTNLLAGDPLAEADRVAEHGLAFAQKARFGFVIDTIATQLGLIRTLRGSTPRFGSFDDEQFDEFRIERRFSENPRSGFRRVLVLDPQAAGAFLGRRLRRGH